MQRYFDAINGHDFKTAWDLGGKNLDSSYASFVAGFSRHRTGHRQRRVRPGHDRLREPARAAADGTQKSYSGQYTVVDGVITHASVTPAD
ncbi:hypothetical protein ACQ4WX_30895 [Streptomyces lasalocidi]